MRIRFTKGLPALVVVFFAVITMAAGVHWAQSKRSDPNGQEQKRRNVKDEVLNTVIDAAPDEVDAEKKAARKAKNKRFNGSANMLLEQPEGGYSGTLLESEPPPFPVSSDLIVVGRIQNRQPYVSDNMSCVYTELTVHVDEILKNNTTSPVYTFEPLIIDRKGGAIRMPNGRIFRYLVGHLGIPAIGKRYVLFLDRQADRDYKLIVGYELAEKTIIPLENFGDRESLLDLTEPQFLDLLKQKISESQAEKGN